MAINITLEKLKKMYQQRINNINRI